MLGQQFKKLSYDIIKDVKDCERCWTIPFKFRMESNYFNTSDGETDLSLLSNLEHRGRNFYFPSRFKPSLDENAKNLARELREYGIKQGHQLCITQSTSSCHKNAIVLQCKHYRSIKEGTINEATSSFSANNQVICGEMSSDQSSFMIKNVKGQYMTNNTRLSVRDNGKHKPKKSGILNVSSSNCRCKFRLTIHVGNTVEKEDVFYIKGGYGCYTHSFHPKLLPKEVPFSSRYLTKMEKNNKQI